MVVGVILLVSVLFAGTAQAKLRDISDEDLTAILSQVACPDLDKLPISEVCAKFYATPVLGTPAPGNVPPELIAAITSLCGPQPQP